MRKYRVLFVASSVASVVGLSFSALMSGPAAMAKPIQGMIAQSTGSLLTSHISATSVGFVPPADDGAPTYSRGGATRNPKCDALQVLPENGSALTSNTRPKVQAYFQEGVKQVWVKVEADDGSEVYTYGEDEYFALPEGEGFAEVPLPESLGELMLDKQYHWTMVLLCDQSFGPSSPRVLGGIRRVAPVVSLSDAETMSLTERMGVYAEAGLWYDYISVLTMLKAEEPGNSQLMQNWEAALRAVNLDIIFDEFENS